MDEVLVGRRRVAAASVAVIAVVLAGLGAAAVGVLDGPDDRAPGVPDRLVAVPDHVTTYDDDAAVGRAAVAWRTYDGHTVLVGADDGAYHLVGTAPRAGTGRLALSPDGRHLLIEDGGALGTTDLRTGETTYVREVRAQRPSGSTSLAWSPDGRWAAWSGPGSTGRVEVATGRRDELRPASAPRAGSVAVADDGTVVLVAGRGVTRWSGDEVSTSVPLDIAAGLMAGVSASPDGSLVAVGSCCTKAAHVVDVDSGAVVTRAGLAVDGPWPRPSRSAGSTRRPACGR